MKKRLVVLSLIALNCICVYAVCVERFCIDVTRYDVPVAQQHAGVSGARIVHISDVHMSAFGWYEQRIVTAINEAKPDLVCITGDFLDPYTDRSAAYAFIDGIVGTSAIAIVPGNGEHEDMRDFRALDDRYRTDQRIAFMVNETRDVTFPDGATVRVVGSDDPVSSAPDYTLLDERSSHFTIALVHCYTSRMAGLGGYDLCLAGHTHGGQVALFPDAFIRTRLMTGTDGLDVHFIRGMHFDGGGAVNVSRGLGVSVLPLRVNARPEITVITLVSRT